METVATPPPSFYAVSLKILFLSLPSIIFLPRVSYFLETDSRQFQSLEPRPRSIYDVLDHSAAKAEPDPREDKPKKKESHKTVSHFSSSLSCFTIELQSKCGHLFHPQVAETKPPGQEDVFESVYENFWAMDESFCTPQVLRCTSRVRQCVLKTDVDNVFVVLLEDSVQMLPSFYFIIKK